MRKRVWYSSASAIPTCPPTGLEEDISITYPLNPKQPAVCDENKGGRHICFPPPPPITVSRSLVGVSIIRHPNTPTNKYIPDRDTDTRIRAAANPCVLYTYMKAWTHTLSLFFFLYLSYSCILAERRGKSIPCGRRHCRQYSSSANRKQPYRPVLENNKKKKIPDTALCY